MPSPTFFIFLPASVVTSFAGTDAERAKMLEGSGLMETDLSNAATKITYHSLETILKNASQFWPHPGLGLHYGNNLSPIDFGLVGQSMATSPTLREAIDLFMAYYKFGFAILDIKVDMAERLTVSFKHTIPQAKTNRFFIDASFAALCRLISSIYPGSFQSSAKMQAGDGGYGAAYQALFTGGVTFGCDENSVTLSGLNLNSRLKHSNPINAAQFRRACEAELRKHVTDVTLETKVREFIRDHLDNLPKISEIAKSLGFSERGLRRQLAKESVSYRGIVNHTRGQHMLELLGDPNLPISEISIRLGYDNYANFSRAFVKQFGVTPAKYRQ